MTTVTHIASQIPFRVAIYLVQVWLSLVAMLWMILFRLKYHALDLFHLWVAKGSLL